MNQQASLASAELAYNRAKALYSRIKNDREWREAFTPGVGFGQAMVDMLRQSNAEILVRESLILDADEVGASTTATKQTLDAVGSLPTGSQTITSNVVPIINGTRLTSNNNRPRTNAYLPYTWNPNPHTETLGEMFRNLEREIFRADYQLQLEARERGSKRRRTNYDTYLPTTNGLPPSTEVEVAITDGKPSHSNDTRLNTNASPQLPTASACNTSANPPARTDTRPNSDATQQPLNGVGCFRRGVWMLGEEGELVCALEWIGADEKEEKKEVRVAEKELSDSGFVEGEKDYDSQVGQRGSGSGEIQYDLSSEDNVLAALEQLEAPAQPQHTQHQGHANLSGSKRTEEWLSSLESGSGSEENYDVDFEGYVSS